MRKYIFLILFLVSLQLLAQQPNVNEYFIVTGDSVRVRSEPTLDGNIIKAYSKGDVVYILRKSNTMYSVGNNKNFWYKNNVGWIYGEFLIKLDNDDENLEQIEKIVSEISLKHPILTKLEHNNNYWSDCEDESPVEVEIGTEVDPVCTWIKFKNSMMKLTLSLDEHTMELYRIKKIVKKDDYYIFESYHLYNDSGKKKKLGKIENIFVKLNSDGTLVVDKNLFYP
jgi:hypothetical protein